MNKSPLPYSYSKVKAFEQCAFRYHKERVLRLYPQAETEAMHYGTMFHEAAELYVRDDTPLPKPFAFIKDALDALNDIKGDKLCEFEMGVTVNLLPCGFKDDDVWWRGICDLSIIDDTLAWVVDYKTGSKKAVAYADKGQLELMALGTFTHFPEVNTVRAALLFAVAGKFIKHTYTRDDVSNLWQKWMGKFDRMQAAYDNDVWNKQQSGLCYKHCPVLECPHNGRS